MYRHEPLLQENIPGRVASAEGVILTAAQRIYVKVIMYTSTYSDGTVEEIHSLEFSDDVEYYFVHTEFSVPTYQWEVGGTYTATASLSVPGVVSGLMPGDFTVTVIDTPIASVEIAPITMLKEGDGYWYQDWVYDEETGTESQGPQYFYYRNTHPNTVTIILKDGTVIEDEFLFGAISNSTSLAGIVTLDPKRVDMSDGKFELLLVRAPRSMAEISECIMALYEQKYDCSMIRFLHASRIKVFADPSMAWTLDGEKEEGHAQVEITNLHHAISLIRKG